MKEEEKIKKRKEDSSVYDKSFDPFLTITFYIDLHLLQEKKKTIMIPWSITYDHFIDL